MSAMGGLLRQSMFRRLATYEDVNDAERLCHDPAMCWVVVDGAIAGFAASASQLPPVWMSVARLRSNFCRQRPR